ncbi:MAG TPA: energy transducer TonB, partial [Sphingomicrobium sp.]|nr:energy transducer TonB [Sphingomicrobium sp.]
PEGLPGPEAQEQWADDDQPPADLEPRSNDNEIVFDPAVKDSQRWSLRAWGAAAAVAGVLGLLILTPWPGLDRQSSAGDEASRVVAAGQESGAGQGFVEQVLGAFNRSASPNPQVDEADAPPAASSAAGPDLQGKSDGETVPVDAAVTASATTAAHPQANATSTSTAPAEATTSSVEAVEAQATAPTPPAAPAPAIATAGSGNAESSARLVHIPPQWVGGGPTDADNPRGRYQGSLTVQVSVEADGSVSKCAPVRGSGNAGLDEMTCRLVRERARFSPALDAQRRPVAAQAYTTIVWGDRRR